MNQNQTELQDRRGLRFPFSADAEVVLESAPGTLPARVTELSFLGCYLEISAALTEQQRVHVKIFHSEEYFEALGTVLYVRPAGVGVVFADVKPHFRTVLQRWILRALDQQAKSKRA